MSAAVVEMDEWMNRRENVAFAEYCVLAGKAQETLSIEDARAAGRAWRRYINLFLTSEQRDKLEEPAQVVQFSRGNQCDDDPPPAA